MGCSMTPGFNRNQKYCHCPRDIVLCVALRRFVVEYFAAFVHDDVLPMRPARAIPQAKLARKPSSD